MKNSNDPNSYQWLNKSQYIHTTECYATIKGDDTDIKDMMSITYYKMKNSNGYVTSHFYVRKNLNTFNPFLLINNAVFLEKTHKLHFYTWPFSLNKK